MKRDQRRDSDIADILLIGRFKSESVSPDELRGIFGQYKIVMLDDIEKLMQ